MLSIGGIKKVKAKQVKSAFGDDDEETLEPATPVTSSSTKKGKALIHVNSAPLSRTARTTIEKAQEEDASIFEYDQVFDSMKAGQRTAEAQRKQQTKARKPQYIEGLLASAQQRKLDRIKAEDVMTAREREKEGDEFVDKDAFVTPAYLAQQEELRKAEEAEKAKEAQGVKKGGMSAFFQEYLSHSAASHEAAMEATKNPAAVPVPDTTTYDEEPESDVQLAKEAAARTGTVVEMNEDGQIVDRTQLLVGGLNVVKKPKKVQGPTMPTIPSQLEDEGGFAVPISKRQAGSSSTDTAQSGHVEEPHHSGLSEAQRRRLQRERQSAELQKQIQEVNERKRKAEEEEHGAQVKKLARRNDETKVEHLKRLAAERRAAAKQKLLEDQAAAATAAGTPST